MAAFTGAIAALMMGLAIGFAWGFNFAEHNRARIGSLPMSKEEKTRRTQS
jgi:hypothetical protein